MGESLNERINSLRKQSRLLLTQVDENSKTITNEIKKLYSQSLSNEDFRNYVGETNSFNNDKTHNSWELRNDSSGVGAALRSEYFCVKPDPSVTAMPDALPLKRIVISSKRRCEHQRPLENICRKPVKGCYCNTETKKVQLRSTRTQYKPHTTCKRCKSHATFTTVPVEKNFETTCLNSPISCETLRRVQKIDYAPKSQFLRNVRSKVSLLEAGTAKGDCPETCSRSQCYHELIARKNIHDSVCMHQLKTHDKTTQTSNDRLVRRVPIRSVIGDEYSSSRDEAIHRSHKEITDIRTPAPNVEKNKVNTKVESKSKRTIISNERQHRDKSKPDTSKTDLHRDSRIDSKLYQDAGRRGEHISEKEMRELRTFREQNYFDTHGSSNTLSSSKSSCSLEQYILNDRLFPEPVRKIHKKDIVVSMPPCATMQLKRIHYFPRYIVRPEKHNFNANGKKKRCTTCPLTGHAIDLGITKIRLPLNSLALKYQKRIP